MSVDKNFYSERFSHISNYSRLLRVVALCLNWVKKFRSKIRSARDVLSVPDLEDAKIRVVRLVQAPLHSVLSNLQQFSPYVDDKGVIRVGGRISRSSDSFEFKHPIILPRNGLFSSLVVRHSHLLTGHGGKGFTLNHVRQSGFFIICGVSLVKSLTFKCVGCRRLRAKQCSQKMSDLPIDRISKSAPFENVGCDFFGPFQIKVRRSIVKRYGCVFTCLYSRAIHIEVCTDLSSDSFILALRRFIALRGPVAMIRCDQGTNFVGASNELKLSLEKMDEGPIKSFILSQNC